MSIGLSMSFGLLSNLFLLLVGAMAAAVIGLFVRFLPGRARRASIAVFLAWLLYAGVLGYKGVIATRFPPGPAFLLIPILVFMAAFLVRSPGVRVFALRVPAALLIGLQVFRVFVEITLHELHQMRLVPRVLTFEGANFDILIGLSAPLVAWLYASRRLSDAAVRVWCWAGIALLANIIVRNLLTFSGALRAETPNIGIGLFPFTFIPGFLAPLALSLHVLLLRSLPRATGLRSSHASLSSRASQDHMDTHQRGKAKDTAECVGISLRDAGANTGSDPGRVRTRAAFATALVLWGFGVLKAGYFGLFVHVPLLVFGPLVLMGIVVPLLVYYHSARFRSFIGSISPVYLTVFYLWRIPAGLIFLYYGSRHLLPHRFVLNAGVGDIAVGCSCR